MTDVPRHDRLPERTLADEERPRYANEPDTDIVVTIDGRGVVTGWSRDAEHTLGWSRAEAVGRELAEILLPYQYRADYHDSLTGLRSGGAEMANRRLQLRVFHRDGRELSAELSMTRIDSPAGSQVIALIRTRSHGHPVEQALFESQQQYQALVESLPNLVWTCRPDGHCDFLSRQWIEYTGRPEEDQLGFGWAEHVHPEDRERVRTMWALATAHGQPYDVEFRIRRADGVYRWFKTRAVPLRNAAGEIVKWFGSNTDFEDHKESERRLEAHVERLNLLDRLTRAIGERQDLESILRVVTAGVEEHLPIDLFCACLAEDDARSLVVTSVGDRTVSLAESVGLRERTRLAVDENGLSRCLHGQLVYEPDLVGVPFPFPERLARGGLGSLVAAPLQVQGSVFGVLIAARRQTGGFSSGDCEFLRQLSEHVALAVHQAQLHSALKKAYDELRQTQQAVMQQERLKAFGQMASGIAHDINNAISPITLYAEWLLENPSLDGEAKEYLSTIQRAIDDVARTVGRMKEFYRSRGPDLLQPVDVNHLARDVLDLTQARWRDSPQQRGISIEGRLVLAADAPSIMGIASELREALANVVFNAADAMPEGGTLTIRTSVADQADESSERAHCVRVEVTDTGMGMDAVTQQRCLEPFFTTKGERGTGLGLAMVYGVTQRHGADLEIDSAVGQGTTVRLTFGVPVETAPEHWARPSANRATVRILVIDDDPLVLSSLRATLESEGHAVTGASSGQTGLDAFRQAQHDQQPFALVITDLGMPNMDGRQVAIRLKEASPDTPIILLTGWGHRIVDDDDVPTMVDHVLSKPPRLTDLRRAVADLT